MSNLQSQSHKKYIINWQERQTNHWHRSQIKIFKLRYFYLRIPNLVAWMPTQSLILNSTLLYGVGAKTLTTGILEHHVSERSFSIYINCGISLKLGLAPNWSSLYLYFKNPNSTSRLRWVESFDIINFHASTIYVPINHTISMSTSDFGKLRVKISKSVLPTKQGDKSTKTALIPIHASLVLIHLLGWFKNQKSLKVPYFCSFSHYFDQY